MDGTEKRLSQGGTTSHGITGDLSRIKNDGAATVAEIKDFLAQMKGRSPQEMLGALAKSGLTAGIVVSILLFIAILVAGTLGPYLLWGPGQQATAAAAPAEPGEEPAAEGQTAEGQPSETVGAPESEQSDREKAVEVMGLGETKTADPDENPLEGELDDLLDRVK
jgi:hypothetical protein